MTVPQRLKVFVQHDRLAREMARRNMSQNGLARGLQVSSGYMSQLLRGMRSPSPALRERLQQFLRTDDFDLLFRIESPSDERGGRIDDG